MERLDGVWEREHQERFVRQPTLMPRGCGEKVEWSRLKAKSSDESVTNWREQRLRLKRGHRRAGD